MSLVTSWAADDVFALERTSNVRSFALDPAWAAAAEDSGFAEPLWIGLEADRSLGAVALGLKRRRGGFSKVVCGSNGGVGILAKNPETGAALLAGMRRRWRPSVLEIFASEPLPASNFEWEPAYTFHVDLSGSHDEIRSRFEKRARNALHRALRNGVTARSIASPSGLDDAFDLLSETSSAKGFQLPPRAYLSAVHAAFRRRGLSEVIGAEQDGDLVAVVHIIGARGLASWWKGGASRTGYRLNASLVAHWKAIEISKDRGFQTYDLGGTNPSDPTYAKIHRFKSSLGGRLVVGSIGRRSTPVARAALRLRSR